MFLHTELSSRSLPFSQALLITSRTSDLSRYLSTESLRTLWTDLSSATANASSLSLSSLEIEKSSRSLPLPLLPLPFFPFPLFWLTIDHDRNSRIPRKKGSAWGLTSCRYGGAHRPHLQIQMHPRLAQNIGGKNTEFVYVSRQLPTEYTFALNLALNIYQRATQSCHTSSYKRR
jgi:hypothetical protein